MNRGLDFRPTFFLSKSALRISSQWLCTDSFKKLTTHCSVSYLEVLCMLWYFCISALFQRAPCPEEHATFLSVITWWWQTGLIWRGWRRPLIYDDLSDLCRRDKSFVAAAKFMKHWNHEVQSAGWAQLLNSVSPLLSLCFSPTVESQYYDHFGVQYTEVLVWASASVCFL